MVTHVVVFKLRDTADIDDTVAKLRAMEGKVPSLREIEVGRDSRPSARAGDVCLVTRFDDWDGLDAYADHPVHRKTLAHMAKVTLQAVKVDFES